MTSQLCMAKFKSLIFAILITLLNGCSFRDSRSPLILDLTALAHTVLSQQDEGTPWLYTYTPCRNGDECVKDGYTDTGMFIRQNDQNDDCQILANWDVSIQPTFTEIDETWTFEYKNGNICNNNTNKTAGILPIFYAYFACNMQVGDYMVVKAGELEACSYAMFIESQWACPGMLYENDKVSFGTYFVIVICSGILLYFMIGWIICAFKNKQYDDCIANIPHVTFWSKLPLLVFHGCMFTKDALCALCCNKSSHKVDYGHLNQ